MLSAITVFLGSFLLFGVQPLMGRTLLPSFGGSATVWTVCLAAYQLLLLAGYAYAHRVAQLGPRTQRRLHLVLLVIAAAWTLALVVARHALQAGIGNSSVPALEVLACVVLAVGIPYVLLAAGSALLQAWVATGAHDRSVYRLYAVSNLGSLLGLLSYPLVVEPFVPLGWQWLGWGVGFVVYGALVGLVARGRMTEDGGQNTACGVGRADPGRGRAECGVRGEDSELRIPNSALPPALTRPFLWLVLPAMSSFLLVATTNFLSLDVTPVPLMWVILLGAFLLSYVVGFSRAGERALPLWLTLAVTILGFTTYLYKSGMQQRSFLLNLVAGALFVFLVGLFLHGWLYAIRPGAARLTRYYLGIAAGGAIGGAAASLLAPIVFNGVYEYPLALVAVAGALAWFTMRRKHPELKGLNETFLVVCVCVPVVAAVTIWQTNRTVAHRWRSFYGTLNVSRIELRRTAGGATTGYLRELTHGGTTHGRQIFLPEHEREATTYYGALGGGMAVLQHPAYTNRPLRVGCIGLGAGTMAVYGRTNDVYRFYEINPQVVSIANNTNLFTFLPGAAARIELAPGDARKSLEREAAEGAPRLDVLVVDAYSGDAIPLHLATQEAFALYLQRLAPDGILAVHVSNWHIDLLPLCKAAARTSDLHLQGVISAGHPARFTSAAAWVFLSRQPVSFQLPAGTAREVDWAAVRDLPMLTDEHGSLIGLIRFGRRPPLKDEALDLSELQKSLFR